jgi:hypothetical protein
VLLRFPAEHWLHLKTSTAIKSTFLPVRLRTRMTRGPEGRGPGHGPQAAGRHLGWLARRGQAAAGGAASPRVPDCQVDCQPLGLVPFRGDIRGRAWGPLPA